jgi:hypothetical protein
MSVGTLLLVVVLLFCISEIEFDLGPRPERENFTLVGHAMPALCAHNSGLLPNRSRVQFLPISGKGSSFDARATP